MGAMGQLNPTSRSSTSIDWLSVSMALPVPVSASASVSESESEPVLHTADSFCERLREDVGASRTDKEIHGGEREGVG